LRIDLFRRFARLSWQDRLLLFQAILWLAVGGLAIVLLPFRRVGSIAARPPRRPSPPSHERLLKVRRVRWATVTAARRVPWRALCFQQGLAAQFMLRQQGIPSVLYYGVAQDDQTGLLAHVWVRDVDLDLDVVGGEIAHRFAILAMFPAQHSTGRVHSESAYGNDQKGRR
jgi:hypothetical protein